MNDAEILNILDLCRGEPSPESWRLICEGLSAIPTRALTPARLDEIEGALDRHWPDELRATMCGMFWDEALMRGRRDVRHRVVRSLRYDRVFIGRFGGIMMRSPDHIPGAIARGQAPQTWEHLSRVNLGGQTLSADDLAAMAAAPMPALRHLTIGAATAEGVRALSDGPWMARLEGLSFAALEPGDEAVEALCRAPLGRLKALELGKTQIGQRGAAAMAGCEGLGALERLAIRSASIDAPTARALSQGLGRLSSLRVDECGIDGATLEALLAGALRPAELLLARNPLGLQGAEVLARLGDGIKALSLGRCGLDDSAMGALAGSRSLSDLETLEIDKPYGDGPENGLTGEGACALLASPHLTRLRRLTLHGRLGRLDGPLLSNLSALALEGDLAGVDWGRLGAELGSQLKSLRLGGAGLSVEETGALLDGLLVSVMEELNLSGSRLDRAGVERLGDARRVERLWLSGCGLKAASLEPLLSCGAAPERLHLDDNDLGDEGIERLAASPLLAQVRNLGLSRVGITDRGALALARSPWLARVDRVLLSGNKIGPEGARALAARVMFRGGWMSVDLGDNPIGEAGKAALAEAPPRCCP